MRKCLPILLSCFLLLCLCLSLFWQPCNVAQAETYTIPAGDYTSLYSTYTSIYTGDTVSITFTANNVYYNKIDCNTAHTRMRAYQRTSGNTYYMCDTSRVIANVFTTIHVVSDTVVNADFYSWFGDNYNLPALTVDIWWIFKTDYNRPYPLAYTYFGELGSTYKVTEPTFIGVTPPNYSFVGWYDESGNLFDFDELQTAENVLEQHYLYARWDTPYDSLFEILILPYTAFFDGFGSGVDWLFNELFIDDSGYYLSTYGQFILYIAGATFVVYIIKTVLYFIVRGDKKCKKD